MTAQTVGNVMLPAFYYYVFAATLLVCISTLIIVLLCQKKRLYYVGIKTDATVDEILPSISIPNDQRYSITISYHDQNGKKHSKSIKYQHESILGRINKHQNIIILVNPKRTHKFVAPIIDGIDIETV
ncbi:MAG: hypothetical protein MK137_10280 [Rickettsiales bacterium]|nr:hypothetical protein [Rickettsiales bacterium]